LGAREHVLNPEAASGQRECARAEWCRDYTLETEDGQTVRKGKLGPRSFCDADRAEIDTALGQLPGYWAHLRAELGKPSADGMHVHMPFGPRVPIRLDIDAQMRLMVETLCSWEERVRDVGRLTPLDTSLSRWRRDGKAITQSARILGAHLDVLLALGTGPMARLRDGVMATEELGGADAGLEILHLKYRARSILGETTPPPVELEGIQCRRQSCDLRNTLYRAEPPQHEDSPAYWSVCAACGDRMTETEYRLWTRRCAAHENSKIRHVPALENLPGVT
jgi:hypothetical protein